MSKILSSSPKDGPADGRIIADGPGFYKPHADSYQYAQLGWMFDMFARGEVRPRSLLATLRARGRAAYYARGARRYATRTRIAIFGQVEFRG